MKPSKALKRMKNAGCIEIVGRKILKCPRCVAFFLPIFSFLVPQRTRFKSCHLQHHRVHQHLPLNLEMLQPPVAIAVIAVRMAQDGVTSQPPIVQHAPAASIPLQMLHSVLAMVDQDPVVVAASLELTVVIVATTVQAGATSPALIAPCVQDGLTAVPTRPDVGEIVECIEKPYSSSHWKSSLRWQLNV